MNKTIIFIICFIFSRNVIGEVTVENGTDKNLKVVIYFEPKETLHMIKEEKTLNPNESFIMKSNIKNIETQIEKNGKWENITNHKTNECQTTMEDQNKLQNLQDIGNKKIIIKYNDQTHKTHLICI